LKTIFFYSFLFLRQCDPSDILLIAKNKHKTKYFVRNGLAKEGKLKLDNKESKSS